MTPRLRLHPLESLLLGIVCVHLAFLPWALGAIKWWAQAASLGLAITGLVVALVPRRYTEEFTTAGRFRLVMWPRLVRFPIFWAGLLMLVYIVVQGLNPAWSYVARGNAWFMQQRPHVAWLPSGVEARFFFGGGAWRTLIVYASSWLTVCSIWIGFTRRRTARYLLVALAINGFALALFALVQRLTTNHRLFWLWPSPNDLFFASFIYKNHAGAYFLLLLGVASGLAAWYYLRGLRRLEKSNPAGLFMFFSALTAVDIVVSYARAATILMSVFLVFAVAAFLYFQFRNPDLPRKPAATGLLIAGLGCFLLTTFHALSAGRAWNRMERLFDSADVSFHSRQLATAATWDMARDHLWLGAGAGSFRYLYPLYQQRYPEIFLENKERLFWLHAHNDLVEFSAEFGLVGCALVICCAGFWVIRLSRARFWENPLSLLIVAGATMLILHAWTDFVFHDPAVWITWCALWPVVVLWTESKEKNLHS